MPDYEQTETSRIVDTAYEMFLEGGYDNVSVRDICRQASITKPTFYKYLSSKENILIALHEKMEEESLRKAAELRDSDPMEALCQCLLHYQTMSANAGWEMLRGYIVSMLHDGTHSWHYSERYADVIEELLEDLQKQGRIVQDCSAAMLCLLLVNSLCGLTIYWTQQCGQFDLPEQSRKLIGRLLKPAG